MVNWESIATSVVLAIVMWMAGTFRALVTEQKKRYEGTEEKLNLLMEAQQATMRAVRIPTQSSSAMAPATRHAPTR